MLTQVRYRPFRRCASCHKRASGRYCTPCDTARKAMVHLQMLLGLPYIVIQKLWEEF